MKSFFSKPYYDTWVNEAPSQIKNWFTKENNYLKKNINANSKVLDVGCGFGRHMVFLAKVCKKIIGIDRDEEMIQKAREKLKNLSNIELYLESAEKMHFNDQTFDYIICMTNTFGTFLSKKKRILKEMVRVLKNRGVIFISVYSENATNIRIIGYEKVGLHIKKVEDGKIHFKEGHTTEQFSKIQLERLFNSLKLNAQITKLTPISYMCKIMKGH